MIHLIPTNKPCIGANLLPFNARGILSLLSLTVADA